jgi:hypothetical protein
VRQKRPDVVLFVALVIVVAFLATGCAAKRHTFAVASQTVAASLFAIQDAENAAYSAGKLTPAQHQKFNGEMVVALTLGREFNTVVRTWQPGQPVPTQLAALRASLFKLSTELLVGLPPDVQQQLQATLNAAYDAVLAVLLAGGK